MGRNARISRSVVFVVSMALLTTACSAERPQLVEDGAAREVGSIDAGAQADSGSEPDQDEAELERDHLTLRLGVGTSWAGDPADAGPASVVGRVLAGLLHEGLTTIDDDGAVASGLARRWFVTADRLRWTFVLDDDVVDGLGESITAADIKLSLEHVAARGSDDQAAIALRAIVGWDDFMNGETGGVAGLAALDATTLVVSLTRPFEQLGRVLASPAFGITGTASDRSIRTTGDYRYTDDVAVLEAVDPEATVNRIELVRADTNSGTLLITDDVDWTVLQGNESIDHLPGDVIRHPLDLRVGLAVRLGSFDERAAIRGALSLAEIAATVPGLSILPVATGPGDLRDLPAAVSIDVPAGPLSGVGGELVAQLSVAGVDASLVESSPSAFAARVASGDATIFPVVFAGGTGNGSNSLSLSTPGSVDDVFGPAVDGRDDRLRLAHEIDATADAAQRRVLINELERLLIDNALLYPLGQFEVRIGVGPEMDDLRMNHDGTLDLSRFD